MSDGVKVCLIWLPNENVCAAVCERERVRGGRREGKKGDRVK